MSMKGLVEGECGGSNPLMRLTSHYTSDRAHLQDGLGPATNISEQGLVTEFLAETRHVTSRLPQTFRMDTLLQEMREIESPRHLGVVPRVAPSVADLAVTDDSWAAEYFQTDKNVIDWSKEFLEESTTSWAGPDPLHSLHPVEGEQLWAEQYLTDVPTLLHPVSSPAINSTADLDWAEEFSQLTKTGFSPEDGNAETYKQDFWKKLENEWITGHRALDTPLSRRVSRSEGIIRCPCQVFLYSEENYNPVGWQDWVCSEFDYNESYCRQCLGKEYKFTEENPVKDAANPLEEGKKRLEEGDLPSAVLFFEAAVQQEPDNTEAWQLLGSSQAENEQDPQAISALKKCASLDPTNLKVWMTLAISFTNELYQAQACHALKMWIQHNPEYSALLPPSSQAQTESLKFGSSFMSTELHQQTTDLYIKAARQRQTDSIDPDIQAGLGVLFNLSGDFDKAVDCFRAAVAAAPTDALLWNRLGATLANSNKSEEAVSAYHKALRFSPGFTRCRYNLGISCINLRAYREAAEHFLTALNFQASGRGPEDSADHKTMSDTIWNSLRLALNMMDRRDLVEHIDTRNLQHLSSEFGIRQE